MISVDGWLCVRWWCEGGEEGGLQSVCVSERMGPGHSAPAPRYQHFTITAPP